MFYTLQGDVEAIQVRQAELVVEGFDGTMFSEMKEWLRALFLNHSLRVDHTGTYDCTVMVLTIDDAEYRLFPGDYIVRTKDGAVYPVKAGLFNLLIKE